MKSNKTLFLVVCAFSTLSSLQAQSAGGAGCTSGAASGAIGTDIPPTYQGPAPSSVDKRLVGPFQYMKSGVVDPLAATVKMPLYRGQMTDGRAVWYVITDTTDEANAAALGVNFSSKLNYAGTGRGVRTATLQKGGVLVFDSGTVDFSPELIVEKANNGDQAFPPRTAKPGSIGDAFYSPLVRIMNAGGHIYNAPIISFGTTAKQINFPQGNPDYKLLHDKIVAIDTTAMTVTIKLTQGFSFAKPVLYLSFEASSELAAALETATLAPAMNSIGVGGDDGLFSAVERIFAFTNGANGCVHPHRQGLNSALLDGRSH